jgi:hypothetical protein
MEPKTIGVKLSKKITYSTDGDFKETAELEFKCPTMASFDEASDLSQAVMNALMDAGKNAPKVDPKEGESGDMDAEAVKIVLMTAERIKFKDVAKLFRKLALKVGTYDGKETLSESVFEKLEIDDFTKCLCEYVANFIFPSLLSGQTGQSEPSTSGSN